MTGKKDLLAGALRYSGANRILRGMRSWRGLIVLNYHRIGDPRGELCDHGVYSARADQFDAQLQALSRRCDVIGLKDLERALLDRRGCYALVTFDDGYRDNFTAAFPVLVARRVPAVFFLTTGFLDDGLCAWWDEIAWMVRSSSRASLPSSRWTPETITFDPPQRERAVHRLLAIYKKLPAAETQAFLEFLAEATAAGRCPREWARDTWMTWDMVREMRKTGMDIGGHTVTHPILSRLSPNEQWREVDQCKRRIESELDEAIDAFSYPVGAEDCFDDVTKDCLARAGFRFGFSFYGGFAAAAHRHHFDVPRFPVDPVVTASRLEALLSLPQIFARP